LETGAAHHLPPTAAAHAVHVTVDAEGGGGGGSGGVGSLLHLQSSPSLRRPLSVSVRFPKTPDNAAAPNAGRAQGGAGGVVGVVGVAKEDEETMGEVGESVGVWDTVQRTVIDEHDFASSSRVHNGLPATGRPDFTPGGLRYVK